METRRSDRDLWIEYEEVIRGHIHPGHDVVGTVNRLLLKSPWLTDLGKPLQIPQAGLFISEESWKLSRLWPLIHRAQITLDEPMSTSGAILTLRWNNNDYLMDGRRRINSWQRNRVDGPHRVLVLQGHAA
jgi:hypothetical protein